MGKSMKCEIYRDSMQNFRRYGIPKAQLIIVRCAIQLLEATSMEAIQCGM